MQCWLILARGDTLTVDHDVKRVCDAREADASTPSPVTMAFTDLDTVEADAR